MNYKLRKARKVKNNEFYTRYECIDDEIKNYKHFLEGKVIFLNCDNPYKSNFWKYFINNFGRYGLKGIISVYYDDTSNSFKNSYFGNKIIKEDLKGNGSFDSKESIYILKNECDVVITNPPFSFFKSYMDLIIESGKDFIILGSNILMNYRNILKYIKEGIILGGYNINKNTEFDMPCGKSKHVAVTWITSFDLGISRKKLVSRYNDYQYEKIDNYEDCIFCKKMIEVPKDYNGYMAIPITGLLKYDLTDYNILSSINPYIDNVQKFSRLIIKKK